MKSPVCPELPTASVGSSQAPTAAVDNSAPSAIRPESTYKSGQVVQTNGATSLVDRLSTLSRSRNKIAHFPVGMHKEASIGRRVISSSWITVKSNDPNFKTPPPNRIAASDLLKIVSEFAALTNTLENFVSCVRTGDLDVDYCVGGKDVEILVSKMGLRSSDKDYDSRFDIVKNSIIDPDDFFRLADLVEPRCPAATLPPPNVSPVPPTDPGKGFTLDTARIKLLIQQGSSLISKLKIVNNENLSIVTRHDLEGVFSSDDKIISFDFLNLLNILPFLGALISISWLAALSKYTLHLLIIGVISNIAGISIMFYQKRKCS